MTTLSHKEITRHLRGRFKACGIPARVRMSHCNGGAAVVQVITPSYDAKWTPEQLEVIALAARVNGLTFVRGLPIDEKNCALLTGTTQFDFYLPD